VAQVEGRNILTAEEMEWVVNNSRMVPRLEARIPDKPQVGLVNGLAVYGPQRGVLLEIEATISPADEKKGSLTIGGIVEEEEMGTLGRTLRRKGTARAAVENVLTALTAMLQKNMRSYDIHLNFPGGMPVDGPSAGVGVALAIYSALQGIPVDNTVAVTGEISIRGLVCPVGGVSAKVEAARLAGAKRVFIPAKNWQHCFKREKEINIIPVTHIREVFQQALVKEENPRLPALEQKKYYFGNPFAAGSAEKIYGKNLDKKN
jgi:Lon-like ATP-dependent protease